MATVEAVAQENGSVFAALPRNGVAVFPAGDAYTMLWTGLAQARACLTFGDARDSGADLFLAGSEWQQGHWQVRAQTPAGPIAFRLHIAGRHNVRNALGAAACALAAGAPLDAVVRGLEGFEPVKGRSRALAVRIADRTLTLVDDSYNANPDSVRAAIDVLAELPGPRLLVLGDMGEVGDQGPAFHAEVGAYARERGIDQLFTLGAQAQAMQGRHFADVEALNAAVLQALERSESVLVKGSRFMKMERVVEAIASRAAQEQAKEGSDAR
jgi:UDP-N-acetylmuramoyl-tripeptide--D-alanyl-D-alanine ligase